MGLLAVFGGRGAVSLGVTVRALAVMMRGLMMMVLRRGVMRRRRVMGFRRRMRRGCGCCHVWYSFLDSGPKLAAGASGGRFGNYARHGVQ